MSSLLGITVKTLWKKKTRTLFSICAFTLGIALLCSMLILQEVMDKSIKYQIHKKYGDTDLMVGYRQSIDNIESVRNPKALDNIAIQKIKETKGILETGLALASPEQYKKKEQSSVNLTGIHYVGVDNSELTKSIYSFSNSLSSDEVVLSAKLAERLHAKLFDFVEIPFRNGDSYNWRVSEIIPDKQGLQIASPEIALFHLETLQHLLELESSVNQVMIKLAPNIDKNKIAYQLTARLGDDLSIDLLDSMDKEIDNAASFQIFGYCMAIITLATSIVLVLSNINNSLHERIIELATIRTVGGSKGQLQRLVIYEALVLGLMGSVSGVLLGVFLGQELSRFISRMLNFEMIILSTNWYKILSIALLGFFFLIIMSLFIAAKTLRISPLEAFKGVPSVDLQHDGKQIIMPSICFGFGVVIFICSYLFSTDTAGFLRVLFSVCGGGLIIFSIFKGNFFIVKPFLSLLSMMMNKYGYRETVIVINNLISERKKSSLIITVIALGLTLFVPISTLLNSVKNEMQKNIDEKYVTEFVISSSKLNRSTLPIELIENIEQINGVKTAIPMNLSYQLRLSNYDFSRSEKSWIERNSQTDRNSKYQKRELLNYVLTDLKKLRDLNLIPDFSISQEKVIVITKQYSIDLGVKTGDQIEVDTGLEKTLLTIGTVVEKLPGYPIGDRIILADFNNLILQNPVNLTNPRLPVEKGKAEMFLVKIDKQHRDEVVNGLEKLQQKYPEIRWGDKQTSEMELSRDYYQRIGILYAVIGVILLIGIMGMTNTLSSSIYSRRREYAILRAIHLTPKQMLKIVMIQSLVFSLVAVFLGLLTGYVLAFSFIHALEADFVTPWRGQIISIVLILAFSLIVSLPMGIKLSRMSISKALAFE
ncbi:FtsX-like permease family protein [Paenibacillus sp. MBLB4367]|uniref:FtsX-like permease family protein n=1 Tax=Paenibacillus sp. MBLB4367 TaxID=3384767 RepID=UPI003908308E